mgnify:CR=1 FL=1
MPTPSVDSITSGVKSSSGTGTCTLSTSTADDWIIIAVYNEVTSGSAPAVSAVTSSNLTFSFYYRSNSSAKGSMEIWKAKASGTLSSEVISITWATGFDDATFFALGVKDCNASDPFDPNASLPAKNSGGAGAWTPSITVSTDNPNDLFLVFFGTPTSGAGTPVTPTSFSRLLTATNAGGTLFSTLAMDTRSVSSTQSSYTVVASAGGNSVDAGESIIIAMTEGAVSSSRASDFMIMM